MFLCLCQSAVPLEMEEYMQDVVIIGGGTAGLTAALYLLRAGKQVLVLESEVFGGQISSSPRVENYPGIMQISGSEFTDQLLEQVLSLGARVEMERAVAIRDENGQKCVVTEEHEYPCKSIIIATGSKHRHLGLPKEEELTGRGVSYCAVCDGAFFRGKDTAVVGGGSAALQSAIYLSQFCSHAYLIVRRDVFRGEPHLVKTVGEKENISVLFHTVVTALEGDTVLTGLDLKRTDTGETSHLPVSGLFVSIGQAPDNAAFSDILDLDSAGYIAAGEDCKTSSAGVFAAGDCRTKAVRQLTTAASDGTVSALAACNYMDAM